MASWLLFFLLIVGCQTVLHLLAFWQITNAQHLVIFGIKFPNLYWFWLGYTIAIIPVAFVIHYIFTGVYWYGYNVVFPGRAWKVQEAFWLSSIIVMFFTAWLYLGELPTKNALVALAFLTGALIAIL